MSNKWLDEDDLEYENDVDQDYFRKEMKKLRKKEQRKRKQEKEDSYLYIPEK